MTPAIDIIKKSKISHKIYKFEHNPLAKSYGVEASDKLNIAKEQVFKTLVVQLDNNQLAVAILPVSNMLNMKLTAKAFNVKKAQMAQEKDVERSTGYVLGGVSPLGQKRKLKTVIDSLAKNYKTIFISAGKRGLEIEIAANDLQKLTNGIFQNISNS